MFTPDDQAAIIALVAPLMEHTLSDAVGVAAQSTPVPTWRPGTCTSADGTVVTLVTDEPGATPIQAGVIGAVPSAGARVMAVFVPGGAVFCFALDGGITGPLSYQPVVTQSGVVTAVINEARYVLNGPQCTFWLDLALTSAGTAGVTVFVTLPVLPVGHAATAHFGPVLYYDQSTGTRYQGNWELSGTTIGVSPNGAFAGLWGNTPNLATANGDVIRGTGTFIWRT